MLNRPRLIEAFRDEFNSPKESAERAIDWVFDQMSAELAKGGTVEFRNFGKFATYSSPARVGKNPRNGEPVDIPAKTRVRFSAGKLLKTTVNGG